MELSLKEVADIFRVSERQVLNWVRSDGLPAEYVANQYRFHRPDLLEWAAHQRQTFSPQIYSGTDEDLTDAGTHFSDALQRGGVVRDVESPTKQDAVRNAVDGMVVPPPLTPEILVDLILAREDLGSTYVGHGIAIPHPRMPVLIPGTEAMVRLAFLKTPIAWTANGQTEDPGQHGLVDKLFFMICATANEHLQLIARLSALLQCEQVRNALDARVPDPEMFETIRTAGAQFHQIPATE